MDKKYVLPAFEDVQDELKSIMSLVQAIIDKGSYVEIPDEEIPEEPPVEEPNPEEPPEEEEPSEPEEPTDPETPEEPEIPTPVDPEVPEEPTPTTPEIVNNAVDRDNLHELFTASTQLWHEFWDGDNYPSGVITHRRDQNVKFAIDEDGVQYFNFANSKGFESNEKLTLPNTLSVYATIRAKDLSKASQLIVGMDEGNTARSFHLSLDKDSTKFVVFPSDKTGGYFVLSEAKIKQNEWVVVSGTLSPVAITAEGTSKDQLTPGMRSSKLYIGCRGNGTEMFNGDIAEIRIYTATHDQQTSKAVKEQMYGNIGLKMPVLPEEATPEEPIEEGPDLPLVGANFAGLASNPYVDASIGTSKLHTHYRSVAPWGGQPDFVANYSAKGTPFIARVPFAFERLLEINGKEFTFKAKYLQEIKDATRHLAANGGFSVLDNHSYLRYYVKVDQVLPGRDSGIYQGVPHLWTAYGSPECPIDYPMFAAIWKRIAEEFKDEPGILGFDLANEPHGRGTDLPGFNVEQTYINNIQQVINAIREADMERYILVGGLAYSGPRNLNNFRPLYNLVDPANKLLLQAHAYPDNNGNGGGTWKKNPDTIDVQARVNDWKAWIADLKANGKQGFAGEFSCAVWATNFAEYLEELHKLFDEHQIPRTQWLAGPGFDDNYGNGMNRKDGSFKENSIATTSRFGKTVKKYGPV